MLGGVEFRAFELAKRQYKKVPRNLTKDTPLYIIRYAKVGRVLLHAVRFTTRNQRDTTQHNSPANAFISYILKQWKQHNNNAPLLRRTELSF